MVAADDRVKVLDFGLAKLLETPADDEAQTAMASKRQSTIGSRETIDKRAGQARPLQTL